MANHLLYFLKASFIWCCYCCF